MKVLKVLLPLLLAVTLVAGASLVVAAQEPEDTQDGVQTHVPQPENASGLRSRIASLLRRANPGLKPRALADTLPGFTGGQVIEIDGNQTYFVVQRGENDPVTVMVDNGTRYYIVRYPLNAISQLRNQAGQTDVAAVTPNGNANAVGLLRQRIAQLQQNQLTANAGNSAGRVKVKVFNAAQLRKANGQAQPVSTPLPGTDVAPVDTADENADPEGWGQWQRFRQFAQKATFDDLSIGDRVLVRLVPSDEKPVARLVLIFKQSPYKRIGGTIIEVSPDNRTITIDPVNDGEPVTLRYNDNTIFNLKGFIAVEPGQLARATYLVEGTMAKTITVRLPGSTDIDLTTSENAEGS